MLVLSPESLLFQKSCRTQGKPVSPFPWYQQKGMQNLFFVGGLQRLPAASVIFPRTHSQTDLSKENKKVAVTPNPVSKRGQNEQGKKMMLYKIEVRRTTKQV